MAFRLFSKDNDKSPDSFKLSGDSTVAEWLDQPSGGAVFREMLEIAGQKESVLKPVRRISLKKLVVLSRGQFTEKMMNDMIGKANSNLTAGVSDTISESVKNSVDSETEKSKAKIIEWKEIVTPNRFEGKTIIVTGAGSGIGRATASRVAREGGKVIAVDVNEERLYDFKSSHDWPEVITVYCDITNSEDIKKVIEVTQERIDGLANIAGIMDNMTPLHEVSDEIWERVMNINVNGMMKLTRAVLPYMLDRKSGSIVNIGSEASLKGSAAGVAYTTSKHAVIGITKSSAFMYGPSGIRVNAVVPGATITNIEAKFESKFGEERVNEVLSIMPDAATAEELAASITFLLSNDSININGAVLPSDNGWSIQ